MPPVTGLADSGYIYVPSGCDKPGARCKLHFSLHGCGVNEYYDGARSICLLMHCWIDCDFVLTSSHVPWCSEAVHHLGFQRWGQANDIVIVFPRIQPHGGTTETQSGCWDGYAQSGTDYALQSGPQMHAMRKMIAAVAGV